MPPNKPKLYKTSGKPANRPTEHNRIMPSTSTLSPEEEQKFELELCWCIQQLQTALKSGKLNNKQVQDHTKSLNTLMSNNAPIVKKRQVMRLSFGDYREKMAAEEKKILKNAMNMKVKPASPSTKSVFVKKSTFASSGKPFRFDFEVPSNEMDSTSMEECAKSESTADTEDCDKKINSNNRKLNFLPSNNSFKFGFVVEDDDIV